MTGASDPARKKADDLIAAARRSRARTLDLSWTELGSVPEGVRELTDLTTLNLSHTRLIALPGWLRELAGLTTLVLDGNERMHLPDWLPDLPRLTSLDLRRQQLTSLPRVFGYLTGLAQLHLDSNRLSELPPWLDLLTGLTTLSVRNNQLTALPAGIGRLTALTTLNLEHNQLAELPAGIGAMTALTTLNLEHNQLTALPESIGRLTGLTTLDLERNQLAALPDSIGDLAGLTALDLSFNSLTALPGTTGGLTGLLTLDLQSNQLRELPPGFGRLTRLTRLDLRHNRLRGLPEEIGDLARLQRLDVQHNRLRDLPERLGELSQLAKLDVGHNFLDALPAGLGRLTGLTALDLRNNPLTSPPPEIVAQGGEAVLAFLRASTTSLQQWASKLMIVGEGRVGKTSLVKALSGRSHDVAEPTTHGLLISRLPLAHPARPVTMELSAWDFGGQDIYHATHQFFLTGRSLFLLVWNVSEGTERGRLRYWLDIITARAPQAPILIVATHTAQRPADIDLDSLRERYPAIVGHFSVDCAARTGVEALHTAVAQAAAGLPLMGASWPKRWVDTAAELIGPGRPPHVSAAALWQAMTRAGVADPEEQQTLALAMHHRGEILYFPEDDDLGDMVVLDPQWLNVRIAAILDDPAVAARRGTLTAADMATVWPDLPWADRERLLNLMDRFDVSYRVRDSDDGARAVVVGWLPQSAPDISGLWQAADREIRVVYELPVLPPGIPGWFLARSHRFATQYRWRTGALLRHPDSEHIGLLRSDVQRNRIALTVRGPLPAAFFAVLDDGLNLTFDRYPGLKITRWIPCRGHGPCDKEFDYAKVISRVKRGEHAIYCDEVDQPVDITGLLTGIAMPARELTDSGLRRLIGAEFERLRADLDQRHGTAQRDHQQLTTMIQKSQQAHCPSVFTIVPDGRKGIGRTRHLLRLYCEEPGVWHPLSGDDGCYEITELADWLRTAGPYLARTLRILRAAVPYAGPILGIAADDLQEKLADELDLAKEVLDDIPAERLAEEPELGRDPHREPSRHARSDADYRVLRAMMLKLDPQQRWGGLSHLVTPEGLSLYLCAEHLAGYQRLPAP
ncbi:hypothetical protein Cs7R123_49460 [Catellatospora sp. TT07R-123]|uniref:leucine-rich repeat domain-containing protein n=1 Tax=Catellatospora sp. TT07R-123 TaxID=2733863 RepID=UPI001B0F3BDD|nr:leucine-rich repeat domain-containing protein [Catellatospora sp. TT07R-123]GHJ47604.1 hypothetical protein Cs7R123_49460 [Catellatospora sp. TT07R-123]